MNICVSSLHHSVSFFKERMDSFLSVGSKKIVTIALVALSIFAACYLVARCCCFKGKPFHDRDDASDNFSIREENIEEEVPLEELPEDILVEIFKQLKYQSWEKLSYANQRFNQIAKKPEVTASLLEKWVPYGRKLEFAKLAGVCLKKLDLHVPPGKSIRLTDEILKQIFTTCPNLLELRTDFSKDKILTEASLASLPKKLQSLDLQYWDLTNAPISKLPSNLNFLELDCLNLTETAMAQMQLFKDLTNLFLFRCQVTDQIIAHLPLNLNVLSLVSCSVTDTAIAQMHQFKDLKNLILARCDLKYQEIARIPLDLWSLCLFRMPLTKRLDFFKNLQILYLNECDVTDEVITHLPLNLKSLYLIHCGGLTENGLKQLHSLKDLKKIILEGSDEVTDLDISYLPPQLESLSLKECKKLTVKGLIQLNQFKDLKELNLSECDVTDAIIPCLSPRLNFLSLKGCKKLTVKGLAQLNQFKYLKELDLSECNVTDAILEQLPQTLQILNLSKCDQLTKAAIAKLPKGIQSLSLSIDMDMHLIKAAIARGILEEKVLDELGFGSSQYHAKLHKKSFWNNLSSFLVVMFNK